MHVSPIAKRRNRSDHGNYRPIIIIITTIHPERTAWEAHSKPPILVTENVLFLHSNGAALVASPQLMLCYLSLTNGLDFSSRDMISALCSLTYYTVRHLYSNSCTQITTEKAPQVQCPHTDPDMACALS